MEKHPILERVEKWNPGSASGWRVDSLSLFKELIMEFPEQTFQAIQVFDFAGKIWGMEEEFQQHPLLHFQMFFYQKDQTVESFAKEQIQNAHNEIEMLSKSKKSKVWESLIQKHRDSIVLIEKCLEEHLSDPLEN